MPWLHYRTWTAELSKEDEEKFGGEMDYSSIDWDYKTEKEENNEEN